jgi:NAD-dependent dihydropyrimidine dehydrogenase PreA subunit
MAHKEQGYRFRIDYDLDHRKKVIDSFDQIVVVPVNTEIKKNQTVLNFDSVKKIVDASKKISVMDCSCRKDLKRCDAPIETCMNFDEAAERQVNSEDARIRSYRPHMVSHEEAIEVLRKSAEAGLVHLAYIDKNSKDGKVGTVCSCCSCCCENLGSILRFGMAPHLLKASAYTSTDESRCAQASAKGCNVCESRCHFGARKVKNGVFTFDRSRCYGCGLCVSTCPANAISLHQLSG